MKLIEMLDRRNQAVSEAKALNDVAGNEGRNFSKSEKVRYDGLMGEVRDLNEQITRAQELQAIETTLSTSQGTRAAQHEGVGGYLPGEGGGNGGEKRMFAPTEQLSDHVAKPEKPFDFGRFLRGFCFGQWDKDSDSERRALSVGADTLGGYTASEFLTADVVDIARNRQVCIAAGAQTLMAPAPSVSMAKITGDMTPYWKPENAPITDSDFTFGRVTANARTLAALLTMSVELSEDMVDGGAAVKKALAEVIQVGLDYACLMASGAGEPMGLINWDINTEAAGGPLTYDHVSNAIQKIWAYNANPGAIILSPRDKGALDRMKNGEGNYLVPPPSYQSLKVLVSNQVPATLGTGADSVAFCGDFSEMIIVIRSPLHLEVAREGGDAFKNMQIMLRCWLRADVIIRREKSFTKITGITA